MGKNIPEFVGEDTFDASGKDHLGIIKIPVPILKGNKEILRKLRQELYTEAYAEIIAVDFSDVAQGCNIYSEYIEKREQLFDILKSLITQTWTLMFLKSLNL